MSLSVTTEFASLYDEESGRTLGVLLMSLGRKPGLIRRQQQNNNMDHPGMIFFVPPPQTHFFSGMRVNRGDKWEKVKNAFSRKNLGSG